MRARQIAPVALIIGLTVVGFFAVRLLGQRDARLDSDRRAEVAAAQIRGRIEEGSSLTESLRRFMVSAAGIGVTAEEFERNASRWLSPAGFPAAAWVEQVPASRRAAYERRVGHPIVTRNRQLRIVPVGSRSSYLPATLVSGIPPLAVRGIDLGGESGAAAAVTRAIALNQVGATPLETLRDGTSGLFLVRFAARSSGVVVEPGFLVLFVSEISLRAATDTAPLQLEVGGAAAGDLGGASSVRKTFTAAGQRFDVAVPQQSIRGTTAVVSWIILAGGLVLAALAGALGVIAARRAKAKAEVDRLFTISPDLIVVAGFDGYFNRVNPAFEALLGYTEQEALTRPYVEFVHPADRERTIARAKELREGKATVSFENRYVCKDGSHRSIEWTAVPVLKERLTYAVGRDVTERRQAVTDLREAEEHNRALAEEQAALRRVATLVAHRAAAEEMFAAVTEEVGRLLSVEYAGLARYGSDDTVTVLATWAAEGESVGAHPLVPGPWPLEGGDLASMISRTGRPVRIDDYNGVPGRIAAFVRDELGVGSSVGSPIVVEGRLWGALFVHSKQTHEPLPRGIESRLTGFTDLVATAIANAEGRAGLARLAEEQAALRRVATLVAEGVPPEEVFSALGKEVNGLLDASNSAIARLEADGNVTIVANSGIASDTLAVGARLRPEPDWVLTAVIQTGRSARKDDYAEASEGMPGVIRDLGIHSSVAAPIVVEGALWGVIIVGTARARFPEDTEQRLEEFTELAATAVANSESRSELAISRRRIVAASDEVRRRIERDLHDGAQQRLVALGLAMRTAEANVPPDSSDLRAELSHIATELTGAVAELQELSRGIHPAILSEGGLPPALRALARRSVIPIELDVTTDTRLPEPIEVAAYFVVSEALANATKHAQASRIDVSLASRDGSLQLSIRDDGVGGADPGQGSGLVGLHDRVEALGGTIRIDSPRAAGTLLVVALPLEVEPAGIGIGSTTE